MKYVAYWAGSACVLGLVALGLWFGAQVVAAIQTDPSLFWLPAVIVGILLLSTLIAVVEYLSDKRSPAEEVEQ